MEASPRVQEEAAINSGAPSVAPSTTPTNTTLTKSVPRDSPSSLPHLIPDTYSDSESDEEYEEEEAKPRYQTRSQTKRQIVSNITAEVILSTLEVTNTKMEPAKLASRQFPLQVLCEITGAVLDDETGDLLEYRQLINHPKYRREWSKSFGNEIESLAQGMPGRVQGTETFFFIKCESIPVDRRKDVTYARIVCNVRPEKVNEPNRTRITVGGDKINYPYEVATTPTTADLLTVKFLLNSILSTPGAKFCSIDIKNFYLCTPLKRYEYVRMNIRDFPDDVIERYKLNKLVNKDGMVFVEIRRGMYGLPQAGLLSQELLEKRLNKHGYVQSDRTPGLWTHKWRPIQFSLVVDDFGVKYVGEENLTHLVNILKEHYEISIDREGSHYLGITIWTGTTTSVKSTSLCQGTSKKPSQDSSTRHQQNHKISCTLISQSSMAQKYNTNTLSQKIRPLS